MQVIILNATYNYGCKIYKIEINIKNLIMVLNITQMEILKNFFIISIMNTNDWKQLEITAVCLLFVAYKFINSL